jgi:hypothetical protein
MEVVPGGNAQRTLTTRCMEYVGRLMGLDRMEFEKVGLERELARHALLTINEYHDQSIHD